jgi:hypothetical protein
VISIWFESLHCSVVYCVDRERFRAIDLKNTMLEKESASKRHKSANLH